MRQSRTASLLEAITNVGLGWLLAMATQLLAFHLVGIEASLQQNLLIGAIFTAVSLARSYLLRRLFNRLATGAP